MKPEDFDERKFEYVQLTVSTLKTINLTQDGRKI
jgi:hypothetical protein